MNTSGGLEMKKEIVAFDVISLDMFQTLVDVYSRTDIIWQRILGSKYTEKKAKKYKQIMDEFIYERFHDDVMYQSEFRNLSTIFQEYFKEVFIKTNVDFSPAEASKIWAEEHNNARMFSDAYAVFDVVERNVPICLVSDSDKKMIAKPIEAFNFDQIFISENVKAYKNQKNGIIFKKMIEYYQVNPERILHIGDASADIFGASRLGIKTCWINRKNVEWKHEIMPNYIVNSLTEVGEILVGSILVA